MSSATLLLLSSVVRAAFAAPWPVGSDTGVPPSFDCAMRKAAYSYGQHLLPRLGAFPTLYYALGLNEPECHEELRAPAPSDHAMTVSKPPPPPADAVYVAPANSGRDGAEDGSKARPYHDIQRAVDAAAASGVSTVVLRGGTFYLSSPIVLDPSHSHLRIVAHEGEQPLVSGGRPLSNLEWTSVNTSNGANIWAADVSSAGVEEIPGLQIDGIRATRARYPNLLGGIEVSPMYGSMIKGADAMWTPPNFAKVCGSGRLMPRDPPVHTRKRRRDRAGDPRASS